MPHIPIEQEYLEDSFANYGLAMVILRERRQQEKQMATTPAERLLVPFPADVSNSGGSAACGREAFATCPTKWVNNYLHRLEPPKSIHLHAGGAFARGMEIARKVFFVEHGTAEDARLAGLAALREAYGEDYAAAWAGEQKNLPNMEGALTSYLTRGWPLEADYLEPFQSSEMGVEFDFALPTGVYHPETSEEILYRGRIDWLARNKNDGTVWVVDDKTTSALGNSWHKQWALDAQPTGYVWAARQYGLPVSGVILRGTSILKKGYGHEEQLEMRTEFMVSDWFAQLQEDVRGMIEVWKRWRQGFRITKKLEKSTCNAYGGCPYSQSCQSPTPEAWFAPPRDPLAAPLPVEGMDDLLSQLT